MSGRRQWLAGLGWDLLLWSGMARLVRARSGIRGLILTFHRVTPDPLPDFAPNRQLQVKPAFLEVTILRLRKLGFDLVDLDEAARRLEIDGKVRPFAVITFEHPYRDVIRHAVPILRQYQCPYAVYATTALVDGVVPLRDAVIEGLVAGQVEISLPDRSGARTFETRSLAGKLRAYEVLQRHIEAAPEPERNAVLMELCRRYGFDPLAHTRGLIADWTEMRAFGSDPLCTVGTATVDGRELGGLDADAARNQIEHSLSILRSQLGRSPNHIAYPGGAAAPREQVLANEFGLHTGVTARRGGLYPGERQLLGLPRIAIDGRRQKKRHVDIYATPSLFHSRVTQRLRRVRVPA